MPCLYRGLTYKELVHKVNMLAQHYNMVLVPDQATGRIPDAVFNELEIGL